MALNLDSYYCFACSKSEHLASKIDGGIINCFPGAPLFNRPTNRAKTNGSEIQSTDNTMLEAWYIYKWLAIIYNDDQDEGILWSIIDMDHEFLIVQILKVKE